VNRTSLPLRIPLTAVAALAIAAFAGSLGGCAPLHYRQASAYCPGGYGEAQIDEYTWRVTYDGATTCLATDAYPDATVADDLLYRCAELTDEEGFDGFVQTGFSIHGPRQSATIRLFRGPKPDDPSAYLARDVIATVGPRIER